MLRLNLLRLLMERCAWPLAASFSIARKARALVSEFLHRRITFVSRMHASLLLISAPAMESQNDFFPSHRSRFSRSRLSSLPWLFINNLK